MVQHKKTFLNWVELEEAEFVQGDEGGLSTIVKEGKELIFFSKKKSQNIPPEIKMKNCAHTHF